MIKYINLYFIVCISIISFLTSCSTNHGRLNDIDSEGKDSSMMDSNFNVVNKNINLFGITTSTNEVDVLIKLQERNILKIDSLNLDEERKLKFAIVEFASIKFGVNPGLTFMTSRFDKEAIDSLVSKISSFYSEPEVTSDFDDEEPQYKYYKWNAFDPDKPYIFIRPIHSEEGGLTMMWN